MAVIKCKMCGGDILLSEDKTFGTCESCGSTMTFPKVSDEQRAGTFNRGNQFRRNGEFDKALSLYEHLVQDDETDAEAHWCCALCRFGIEYVEDPGTFEYIPTCHRASFDSILEDPDYLAALENSDGVTKRQYQKDAAKIAEVQRGILATSQKEEPFDVFICYKETDANGNRTIDSTLAQDIYYQLTDAGKRVFFSRITLEDKAGTEYEPYIFAALNSAKVMVLVTTSAENANAVWVKNEWSRFLALMRKDRSKILLPCYRDMDPYDLPEQLSVLQSYDMSKIGFIQDLIRGVNKVTAHKSGKAEETVSQVKQTEGNNARPLLERAFMFLEDGNWEKADEFCEQVLNLEPKNAEAYLGKLMSELKVPSREQLKNCSKTFTDNSNYQKACRFSADIKKELEEVINSILYRTATDVMKVAKTEEEYKTAGYGFTSILGYRDAEEQAAKCQELADNVRKNAIYSEANNLAQRWKVDDLKRAIEIFEKLDGWNDSEAKIIECQNKIERVKKEEKEKQIEAEKKKKKAKRITAVALLAVAVCIAVILLLTLVIIPKLKLNKAMNLLDSGDYDSAYVLLEEFGNREAIVSNKYDRAIGLMDSGDYDSAYALLEEIGNSEAIASSKYDRAIVMMDSGDYVSAYKLLNGLSYKNSNEKALECVPYKLMEELKDITAGKTVKFGFYEQDNDTSNGKEEIEWEVLVTEGNKALLVSKYGLDCKPYNTEDSDVTWETCTLRKWLNDTFYNEAFYAKEQDLILTTEVTADKNPEYGTNPGNDTQDKIFLPSIMEVENYSNEERQCKATEYAISNGTYVNSNGNCWWWLRSPGSYSNFAAHVLLDGHVFTSGYFVYSGLYAVRPALWIDITNLAS